tara:strand:+ start:6575 stop:6808 length:234 start_codon:yes stop_codon:yes gene_type:complete
MRFIDNDGKTYKSTTKKDLAQELFQISWAKIYADDRLEWCKQCSVRVYEMHGYLFEFSDEVGFIDEMIFYGLIREVN